MKRPVFAIRDDLVAASPAQVRGLGRREAARRCDEFVDTLAGLFDELVPWPVTVAGVAAQRERFADVAADWRRTGAVIVSGDVWTRGDVNVAVSRRFDPARQSSAAGVAARPGAAPLAVQASAVRAVVAGGPWVWVDDDVVTGTTMRTVARLVGSKPVGVVSLIALGSGGQVVDVVDARDFVDGACHGGLVVAGRRVPYHHGGVDLEARASVPEPHHVEFRRRIRTANRRLVA